MRTRYIKHSYIAVATHEHFLFKPILVTNQKDCSMVKCSLLGKKQTQKEANQLAISILIEKSNVKSENVTASTLMIAIVNISQSTCPCHVESM